MMLAYLIVKKHFDRPTAVIALVLTAILPVNIAYARFGWDPSHSGLVVIVAAHFALAGSPWKSALVFAVALTVHPTNVFVAPFLVFVFLAARAEPDGWKRAVRRSALYVAFLVVALGVLAITSGAGDHGDTRGRPRDRAR